MNSVKSYIVHDPKVCYTRINDEIIVLNPDDENFYHLNATAVDLWLSLETPKTISELTHLLAQKYLTAAIDYNQDIVEWVQDTAEKGLLMFQETGSHSTSCGT